LRETSLGVSVLPYGQSGMADALALSAAIALTPALIQWPVDDILSIPGTCLVVDTPPGSSSLLAAILPRADLLVTVLLVDATSTALIPMVEQVGCYGAGQAENPRPAMGFVLNQFDPRTRLGGAIADAATKHLGERLLGIVYRDEHVAEAVAAQKVLANYAPASKANHDIAAICGEILTRLQRPAPATDSQYRRTLA
jgi:cellulose biosynthesis protein BcsQ